MEPRKQKLTQPVVSRLIKNEIPSEGQAIFWDNRTNVKGFGLRLTANGAASYILNYRFNGQQRRCTLGSVGPGMSPEDAYDKADELKRKAKAGEEDPLVEKKKLKAQELAKASTSETLEQFAMTDYLEGYCIDEKRPKAAASIRDDKSMLEKILLPAFGNKAMADIRREEVEKLHREIGGVHKYRANRVLSLLSKIFNLKIAKDDKAAADYDVDKGDGPEPRWVMRNPVKGVKRYEEHHRERWLTTTELAALRKALDRYRSDASDAIKMLILTGAREGEVLRAEWSEFDLARGYWHKPRHHMKGKKPVTLRLGGEVLKLLQRMAKKKRGSGRYLFPGRGAKNRSSHRAHMKAAWTKVCKNAGLAVQVPSNGRTRRTRWKASVRLHDLRHTLASTLVSNGVSLAIVQNILGHARSVTTERYSHLSAQSQQKAMNDFSALIKW